METSAYGDMGAEFTALRVYRRYPNKQMRQVMIYLKPTGSELVQQTAFIIPGTRHEFEVIRLWEVPTVNLLPYSGLLPLAMLSRTEDKPRVLQQIAQQIETLPNPGEKSNIAAATSVLAGLVLEKAVIRQILREEIMRDSVIYQDILERGVQQGRQEGRQEGEVILLLRLLKRRFGLVEQPLDQSLERRICSLPVEQLEALGEALLDFETIADLEIWLQEN